VVEDPAFQRLLDLLRALNLPVAEVEPLADALAEAATGRSLIT
jgi:hypothetical protein